MVSNVEQPERRSIARRLGRLLPLALLVPLLVGCGDAFSKHPQNTFNPKGDQADSIYRLIMPVLAIAGVVFFAVMFMCVFVAIKFRARDQEDYEDFPKQIHGNFRLEVAWTILPALILIGVAVPTVATVFKLNDTPPADAVHVEVIGNQWWWEYRYDLDKDGKFDDLVTANDLVVPAGREIALTVTARDVIHSFWVPELNGKRDAVPNRRHPWKIEAHETGEYMGQCAEFCGLSHAEMRIKVIAVSENDFADWTKRHNVDVKGKNYSESDTSPAAEGYRTFNAQLCSSCHLIDGVNNEKFSTAKDLDSGTIKDRKLQDSRHAPQLTHLMGRTTFAGAKFDLRKDTKECRALGHNWADTEAGLAKCFNRPALEAWLRDPPGEKAMAPDGVVGRSNGRGMPNLQLSEDQIDSLVAYLVTLK